MTYNFRKMTSKDLDLMVTFEKKSRELEPNVFPDFNEEKYKSNFKRIKIEDTNFNDVILCIENSEVIGRIDLISEYSYMDFYSVGYVDWVYVLKSHRGRGIAKKLFLKAEKVFKEHKIEEYYLFVASNEEAQKFYKSIDIKIENVEKASKKLVWFYL